MQRHLLLGLVATCMLLSSCRKAIEKKKEDIIINAMTNGRWYVLQYRAAGTDVTAEFTGYEFQFYADGKVDGIVNSNTSGGTWSGDPVQYTITSNFPGSSQPLNRLNGLWKLTDNTWTDVNAYNVNGADTNYLKLKKK